METGCHKSPQEQLLRAEVDGKVWWAGRGLARLEGKIDSGANGMPDKVPGNQGMNPGHSQAGKEKKEGSLPRDRAEKSEGIACQVEGLLPWGLCKPGQRVWLSHSKRVTLESWQAG